MGSNPSWSDKMQTLMLTLIRRRRLRQVVTERDTKRNHRDWRGMGMERIWWKCTEWMTYKGPFILSVSVYSAMLLTTWLGLNCLDFLINQMGCTKNWLQPQLLKYDASIDGDAPNQSFTLSVNMTLRHLPWTGMVSSDCYAIQSGLTKQVPLHTYQFASKIFRKKSKTKRYLFLFQASKSETFPRIKTDFAVTSEDVSVPSFEPIEWKYHTPEEEIAWVCCEKLGLLIECYIIKLD